MKKAVLFLTFNRFEETKKAFVQIAIAKPPRLYLASDGPRQNQANEKEKITEIRNWLLDNINWDCEVKTRFLETNSGGCRYGVSGAINWFFESEEDGIILEDDLIANQSFFMFCEEMLDKYKNNKKIWHIAGNNPLGTSEVEGSYYFAKIQHCWGWATWKDRWTNYHQDLSIFNDDIVKNFSDKKEVQSYWKDILHRMQKDQIDTWDYQWVFIIVEKKGLCVNPAKNLVSNIGYTGVHYKNAFDNKHLGTPTYELKEIIHPEKIEFNEELVEEIYKNHFDIKPIPTTEYTSYKVLLFNFIPLIGIKKRGKHTKIKFLGIPILKIKEI